MSVQFSRTEMLIGKNKMNKLKDSYVAVFGIGGVGGFACEALARAGVEHFLLVDNDKVDITNINRQIIATHNTVGLDKVLVMRDRILSINPDAIVDIEKAFFLPENSNQFDFKNIDYIVDAVDTVSAKIELAMKANEYNVPIISCMGTGNKMNPTMLEVTDIYKTSVCPLARVMRNELKKRRIKKLKVVYSKENPIDIEKIINEETGKAIPGSISFVPSCAGLIIASEVVKDLIGDNNG